MVHSVKIIFSNKTWDQATIFSINLRQEYKRFVLFSCTFCMFCFCFSFSLFKVRIYTYLILNAENVRKCSQKNRARVTSSDARRVRFICMYMLYSSIFLSVFFLYFSLQQMISTYFTYAPKPNAVLNTLDITFTFIVFLST